ncbi:MAG TPA: response regulator [Actinomycetota bacterium]|jgi:CheY-like chemotaxis protein|nr:response regulator [Actinomycetota bacterium]
MSRVLLIDDEPDMAGLVAMCLDAAEVVRAPDLTEAVAEARRQRPDVVLLDLALGSTDGLELLPQLRSEPALAGVPIVAFTVHGSREREAMASGTDGFVAKPFKAARLRRALAPYLDAGS